MSSESEPVGAGRAPGPAAPSLGWYIGLSTTAAALVPASFMASRLGGGSSDDAVFAMVFVLVWGAGGALLGVLTSALAVAIAVATQRLGRWASAALIFGGVQTLVMLASTWMLSVELTHGVVIGTGIALALTVGAVLPWRGGIARRVPV